MRNLFEAIVTYMEMKLFANSWLGAIVENIHCNERWRKSNVESVCHIGEMEFDEKRAINDEKPLLIDSEVEGR
jgi:hypothetical protein